MFIHEIAQRQFLNTLDSLQAKGTSTGKSAYNLICIFLYKLILLETAKRSHLVLSPVYYDMFI